MEIEQGLSSQEVKTPGRVLSVGIGELEAVIETGELIDDRVREVALKPEDEAGILVERFDIDGSLAFPVGMRVVFEFEIYVRTFWVFARGLGVVVGGLGNPDAVVRDRHFVDGMNGTNRKDTVMMKSV